jgi:hypothetical protein
MAFLSLRQRKDAIGGTHRGVSDPYIINVNSDSNAVWYQRRLDRTFVRE